MEAQTDTQLHVEQGKQQLAQGHAREAAIAYAHAAQLDRDNPLVHLGLAEANLALGDTNIVRLACQRVMELQPAQDGPEHCVAQALLDLLEKRYPQALELVTKAIQQEPGVGYMYALRAYLLRATGQDYDAGLERARAARFSSGGRYENCFPELEPRESKGFAAGYGGTSATKQANDAQNGQPVTPAPWAQRSLLQRQVVRTRFALSRYPALLTYILMGINVLIFLIGYLLPSVNTYGVSLPFLINYGAQINPLVAQGEFYRIFTAMFLHDGILHVGLNMLSLFFIGPTIEMLYGKWRFITIYLVSGIVGGILSYFLMPDAVIVGASGAIFGVFGAMGTFFFINRNSLVGRGFLTNWIFWLGLNLVFGFSPGSNIAIWGHIGGLVAGMILAYVLMPRKRNRVI